MERRESGLSRGDANGLGYTDFGIQLVSQPDLNVGLPDPDIILELANRQAQANTASFHSRKDAV